MKAKDLAALLLENPEADVFHEGYYTQDFGDSFHFSERVVGIQTTPSGFFISTEYIENNDPLAPSDKPQVGAVRIQLFDGTWFRCGEQGCNVSNLRDFMENEYICNYVDWHSGTWILTVPGYSDGGYIDGKIGELHTTHYTTDDVLHVEIITEVPDDTWKPVWQKFKWEEALEFIKAGII
jgi:hypothetical protein